MGKRKERQQQQQKKKVNIIPAEGGDEQKGEGEGNTSKFFACYLLTSLCPRFKGHTYIGFTVNPRRRIRQHNGEVRMGAFRTKKKRPWEMVLCIYGFPTNVSALQFEWAWQHPVESRAVRQAAASFKTLGGVSNKIKMAYTMLTLPAWQSLNLTVNFFSTKYKIHSAGCPSLPEHMRVQVCPLDELPCYTGIDRNDDWDNTEECEDESSDKLSNEGSVESTASNSSAGNQDSTEENVEEHIDWIEELDEHAEENSSPHKEDPEQTYIFIDSPIRASSSLPSGSIDLADNFDDNYELDVGFGSEFPQRKLCQDPLTMKNAGLCSEVEVIDACQDPLPIKNAGLSHEVEVIDIFTPPCYKVAERKKRRLSSTACPEIIDLTESPILL